MRKRELDENKRRKAAKAAKAQGSHVNLNQKAIRETEWLFCALE